MPLALAILWRGDLAADRLYAQSWLSWRMLTVSAGYFVYDVYVHLLRFEYAAGLAHAIGACVVFCVGTSLGILHFYGAPPCRLSCAEDIHMCMRSLLVHGLLLPRKVGS